MRVGILGPLEVEQDGRPVAVGGSRLRALLARLALDPGRPVTAGALADAVWDEALPADHVHALQSLVSRLRRSVGADALVAAPGGYRLAVEPDAVDAHRFETLAAAGSAALRAGEPERAAQLLTEALALWRGPALADIAEPRFAVAAAARLQDLRIAATADRIEAELALGHGDRLVAELEALSAEHPLHERLAGQLIAALYSAGRQADALAAYERVRALLSDELGVVPSPDLQAVHLAVVRGELPVAAKPAAERPARRSNLRAPVTSFVGREGEIERIGGLLERNRLVTLVGPGGAGKTRLAGEVVGGWVDRVQDGVWMVELAPVTEEVEVVPALLGALGLREAALIDRPGPSPPRDGLPRLLDVLADRESIVVLDNCEHLIATTAALADELLGHCPRLRIVATSREPLAIAGEQLAEVPPLGLPAADAGVEEALAHPAVELFADRAAAARPGFAVDVSTVAAVVEICRRLDGLPLAIELAAARLRSLPVAQIAERLDDRFRLLTGGSRAALPRHRTLRAVVDWSWELLDEPERRLARRLAVFAGGATEESAAAVDGDDVLDGLTALVERSLLQVVPDTSPPRYRMLETIREYGLERLADAGEIEATRTAHAHYFAALADTAEPHLRGARQPEWFARLEDERDDLVAALRWLGETGDARAVIHMAVTLLWFWMLAGAPGEATTWVRFALTVPGDADPVDRLIAEGLQTLIDAGGTHDAPHDTLAPLVNGLDEIDVTQRPLLAIAKPMLTLFSGDVASAERRLAEAFEHPDPWVRATAFLMRAHQAENVGDLEHMLADLEHAEQGYRDVGDGWGLAMTLSSQCAVFMMRGDLDAAEVALDEAREQLGVLNRSASHAMIQLRLSDIRSRRGDLEGARADALGARDAGDLGRDEMIYVQAMLARIHWLIGDVDEARAMHADAVERLERMGPVRREQGHAKAITEAIGAGLALEDGDIAAAERGLAAAFASAVGTGDMPIVAAVGVVAAYSAAHSGRPEDAAEILGACAVLRGAEDATNPEISRLTARLRDTLGEDALAAAYARGRALPREDALARVDPTASGATAVGP